MVVHCNYVCLDLKEALIASLELSHKLAERATAAEKEVSELKMQLSMYVDRHVELCRDCPVPIETDALKQEIK